MIFKKDSRDRFTVVDNIAVQCDDLSYKAIGVLTYLLSKPTDWQVTLTDLANNSPKEGKESVRNALKELEDAGFATLLNVRLVDDGTFMGKQWFVSDDQQWIASLKELEDVPVTKNEAGRLVVADIGETRRAANPTSGKPDDTKEREKQIKESKSHSPDSVESDHDGLDEDDRLNTWQYQVCDEVYEWLKVNDLLKGKAKALSKEETILGKGRNKGWWDIVDKLHRLDEHTPDAIGNAMRWLMWTVEDEDDNNNPQNGGFWVYQAGWCSMATLRKTSRGNSELKQFDQIYAAFERWNKRRKK